MLIHSGAFRGRREQLEQRRELLFFEWVVIDSCNLNCSYCVNKGEFSQKPKAKMTYVPGKEIAIAEKIVELSPLARKVVVNLTGGEPLLAENIREVLSILGSRPHIEVRLISNFSNISKIEDKVGGLASILVSLHIRNRSAEESKQIVDSINRLKDRTSLQLSQVNYKLSAADRQKLAQITAETGLDISFQPFIPPWTKDGQVENGTKISDATFVPSSGKRCSLGYFHFFLNPDGSFYYGLWCQESTRKIGNFLEPLDNNQKALSPEGMQRCPSSSCGCNYNTFCYDEYLAACQRLGYRKNQIFHLRNVRLPALFRMKLASFRNRYLKF